MLLAATAAAGAGITREEALALAFPGASIQAEQLFLTTAQQMAAAAKADINVPSALVARYIATRDGRVVGRAYVDTATVRTKNETLLISLDATGEVRRIDVTAFLEPAEYLPPDPWLRQYTGRPLSEDLDLNRAIRPIAGATLTARAVNGAVRRVLAIDSVLTSGPDRLRHGFGPSADQPPPRLRRSAVALAKAEDRPNDGRATAEQAASRQAGAPQQGAVPLVSRPRGSRHHSRAGHPGWLRCSSLKYSRYSRSSRLAIRAPRSGTYATTHGDGALGGRP